MWIFAPIIIGSAAVGTSNNFINCLSCFHWSQISGSNIRKFNANKISNAQEWKISHLDHPFIANSKTTIDTTHNIKERIRVLSFHFITKNKKGYCTFDFNWPPPNWGSLYLEIARHRIWS
jgi:hypothetical protein